MSHAAPDVNVLILENGWSTLLLILLLVLVLSDDVWRGVVILNIDEVVLRMLGVICVVENFRAGGSF